MDELPASELDQPSIFNETMRFFTFGFMVTTGWLLHDIIEYFTEPSSALRAAAVTPDRTWLSIVLSFVLCSLVFLLNGLWLSFQKRKVGPVRAVIGAGGLIISAVIGISIFGHGLVD